MKKNNEKRIIFKSTALLLLFFVIAPMLIVKKKSKGKKKLYIEDEVLMLTYNIGDCTFGNRELIIPPKRVKDNLNGIISLLKQNNYDVILLQESNWLNFTNYFINASKKIANTFPENSYIYGSNSNILNYCDNGNMTLSKYNFKSKCLNLPLRGTGLLNDKFYVHKLLIETRIKIENTNKDLVVYNIHLAPYTKNQAVRLEQIKYIFNLAKLENDLGNYVVIGGDWNLNFAKAGLLESELNIFGENNWSFEIVNKPTYQSINKTGKINNKTIDGFLFSPNLKGNIRSLEIFDYSDHSPVELKLRFKK